MTTLRVTKIDGRLAVTLPADLAERLKVSQGGEVRVVESSAGIFLSSIDGEFSTQLSVARGVMDDDEEALDRLAE